MSVKDKVTHVAERIAYPLIGLSAICTALLYLIPQKATEVLYATAGITFASYIIGVAGVALLEKKQKSSGQMPKTSTQLTN